ncbi:unnamed protein product, partial [Mycena citricolor]
FATTLPPDSCTSLSSTLDLCMEMFSLHNRDISMHSRNMDWYDEHPLCSDLHKHGVKLELVTRDHLRSTTGRAERTEDPRQTPRLEYGREKLGQCGLLRTPGPDEPRCNMCPLKSRHVTQYAGLRCKTSRKRQGCVLLRPVPRWTRPDLTDGNKLYRSRLLRNSRQVGVVSTRIEIQQQPDARSKPVHGIRSVLRSRGRWWSRSVFSGRMLDSPDA